MRVLVLSNMYPPHHYGGYELSCHDVVTRFLDRGHPVEVLTSDLVLDDPGSSPIDHESAVHRELELYWRDHELLNPPFRRRLAIERSNQEHLRMELDRLRPDVVSVWNMASLSLGLLTTIVERGVPIVYVICNDWLVWGVEHDAWMRIWRRHHRAAPLAKRLSGVPTRLVRLDRSGTFCFISDATRRWATDHTPMDFSDSTVVYSGIEPELFPPSDPPSAPKPWQWRLLYAGRIDREKGVACAVRALARLPQQATLTIDGPGDRAYIEEILALARDLGVSSRMHVTRSPRAELASVYRSADVVVFPTQWEEPFGLAPVEAMACGTPVVATGAGGSAEFLVDGVNALLFERGDAAALARLVNRLADEPTLRQRLVERGVQTARALTVDQLADCLEAWHTGAVDRFANGRPSERRVLLAADGAESGP